MPNKVVKKKKKDVPISVNVADDTPIDSRPIPWLVIDRGIDSHVGRCLTLQTADYIEQTILSFLPRVFVRWCSVFDGNPKTVIRRPKEMPCVPQKPNLRQSICNRAISRFIPQ